MTRFQLIFRREGRPDSRELWDNNHLDAPHIQGKILIDGQTYTIYGVDWILSQEPDGSDGLKRFVCTLVAQQDGPGKTPS